MKEPKDTEVPEERGRPSGLRRLSRSVSQAAEGLRKARLGCWSLLKPSRPTSKQEPEFARCEELPKHPHEQWPESSKEVALPGQPDLEAQVAPAVGQGCALEPLGASPSDQRERPTGSKGARLDRRERASKALRSTAEAEQGEQSLPGQLEVIEADAATECGDSPLSTGCSARPGSLACAQQEPPGTPDHAKAANADEASEVRARAELKPPVPCLNLAELKLAAAAASSRRLARSSSGPIELLSARGAPRPRSSRARSVSVPLDQSVPHIPHKESHCPFEAEKCPPACPCPS